MYFTNKDFLQDVLETKLRPLEEMVPLINPLTAVMPMHEQNKFYKFAYLDERTHVKAEESGRVARGFTDSRPVSSSVSWRDGGNVADRDVQAQEVRDVDDKTTLRSELMFGVFKPFFPQCRKIDLDEFSVTLMHEFWALRETKEKVRGKYVAADF